MNTRVRLAGILAATVGLIGLPLAATASAAGPLASSPKAFSCYSTNILTATDSEGQTRSVPTARTAGAQLDDTLRIHNSSSQAVPNAFYTFVLEDTYARHGGTPTVWWRIGSGYWHLMPFHWSAKALTTQDAGWQSPNLAIGNIPAHGTISVEVSLSFPAHSIKGIYPDLYRFGSPACDPSFPDLGWLANGSFGYWPWKGLEGSPS